MACGLQPAGAAASCGHVLPSPRRSAAAKGRLHQVACMHQFHWKLALRESDRCKSLLSCKCSGSSAKTATSSRPANVWSTHDDLSSRHCMDAVPGGYIVISGYWSGPDMDDGCGTVEAILQRIL